MNQLQIDQRQNLLSWVLKILLLGAIAVLFSSCSHRTPPEELAPNNQIIKSAIAFEIAQTEQALAQQLETSLPDLKITNIRVEQLEPIYIANLPTYHLQGKYNLKLKLPRRQANQTNNLFDLYLQRQVDERELSVTSQEEVEQTPDLWRLLKREKNSTWSSIPLQ
ncbi:hypothetical protein Sta7437_1806 [Stanieria cyanosphaera PCC 7437]|uniref:Uncharacterized protein n=1 Tax=Stanieria cyanosphaera (strain ATCC 29371 / PCC 7437) TaxID=111780 RepID=K9XTH5_STAC7|nr:hypothetical protein [Stanieria cyanosphaera]AFZ35364.1 hypothetical protein Sta7437_1806 [Stanieria cyanosphaera PCC 7437]